MYNDIVIYIASKKEDCLKGIDSLIKDELKCECHTIHLEAGSFEKG